MPESFQTFRDPFLSLYQSAVAEVAKKIDEMPGTSARGAPRLRPRRSAKGTLPEFAAAVAQREYNCARGEISLPGSAVIPRDLSHLGIAQVCAEWGLRYMKALAFGDDQAVAQLRDEYKAGTCDKAWLTTLDEYKRYFGPDGKRKPIPYVRPASVGAKTIEINADARVALMGDWGTGAPPAIEVLKLISGDKPDVLVHLGDIYYSGTPTECREHFTDPINLVLRKASMLPVLRFLETTTCTAGGWVSTI